MLDNYNEALVDFDKALAINPENAFALERRGETHQMLKNYNQALIDF